MIPQRSTEEGSNIVEPRSDKIVCETRNSRVYRSICSYLQPCVIQRLERHKAQGSQASNISSYVRILFVFHREPMFLSLLPDALRKVEQTPMYFSSWKDRSEGLNTRPFEVHGCCDGEEYSLLLHS
ncbi:hypothetical protein ACOMHN_004227 [Nucella lapillus]